MADVEGGGAAGAAPGHGLGPRGLNRQLDITFGRVPSKAILYLGHARLTDAQ